MQTSQTIPSIEIHDPKKLDGFEILGRYETMLSRQLFKYQDELRTLQNIRLKQR